MRPKALCLSLASRAAVRAAENTTVGAAPEGVDGARGRGEREETKEWRVESMKSEEEEEGVSPWRERRREKKGGETEARL